MDFVAFLVNLIKSRKEWLRRNNVPNLAPIYNQK